MKQSASRWRQRAAITILRVITENLDADEKTLRKLISAEYPFGPRSNWPYLCWLKEVRHQLDRHFKRATWSERPPPAKPRGVERRKIYEQQGQLRLL